MDRSGTPLGFALLFLFALAFGWVAYGMPTGDSDGSAPTLTSYSASYLAEQEAQPPLVWPDEVPGPLTDYVGRRVEASGLRVTAVDADEGFWVEKNGRRTWIQLAEPVQGHRPPESAYTVRVGDDVSLSGQVVPHDPNYPSRIYFCTEEGPGYQNSFDDVAAAGVHLAVQVNELNGVS